MNDNDDNNNDDFLNNIFNDDFFKNSFGNLNPEDFLDENGEIDYDKLKAESFKIFEDITGENADDLFNLDTQDMDIDKLLPRMGDNSIGVKFVQDLDSEEGKAMFDDLVKQHNLTKTNEIVDVDGEDYIHETWCNNEGTVNVKRVYKLNDNTTSSMLSTKEQIELYQSKMENAVDIEDYEEAAKLRDIIKTLKNA